MHWLAPGKRILHDDRLDLDELTGWIAERHRAGTGVALHCVTASQLVVTLAALRSAGTRPDDRIEHAAVVPVDAVAELAALGVLVVTQPNFVAERGGRHLTDVEPADQPALWRLATLLAGRGSGSRCPPTCRSAAPTRGPRCVPRCTGAHLADRFSVRTKGSRPQRH